MDERINILRQEYKEKGNPILREESFKLLLKTVKERKAKTFLEIGVNTGLTGIAVLTENPSLSLSGIEIDEDAVKIAKKHYKIFGVENRAKIFLGDASEIIPLLSGKYDFIFLDGPKGHYFEYVPYLINALNKNGILFADNVLFHGFIEGDCPKRHLTIKTNMLKFLDYIENNENLKTTIYHIEDGVSITEKIK